MFITFEGVDSCGKTTQVKKLYDFLSENNKPCILTKEPGGSESANKIRSLLLENSDFLPLTQLLLINASRSENIFKIIQPSLNSGKIVLCDRFIDSTTIYQAKKAGLGEDIVKNLHSLLFANFMPDVTFYLKINKQTAVKRVEGKKTSLFSHEEHNWMDDFAVSEITKMIDWFNEIFESPHNNNRKIFVIDANQNQEDVFKQILNCIKSINL